MAGKGSQKWRVLDLYSGLGGFTSGFIGTDFAVTRVDNCSMTGVDGAGVDYCMDCDDFLALAEDSGMQFDVVLAGPPCECVYSLFFYFNLGG